MFFVWSKRKMSLKGSRIIPRPWMRAPLDFTTTREFSTAPGARYTSFTGSATNVTPSSPGGSTQPSTYITPGAPFCGTVEGSSGASANRCLGEDGEDRLVVVVQPDAEQRGLVEPDRQDAVPEGALQSEPGRKDCVRLHVLAHRDIDADRPAVKRELAKPAVDVAAARALREGGLLAVVVHDKPFLLRALRHAYRVGVVAFDPRIIFRIHDNPAIRGKRRKGNCRGNQPECGRCGFHFLPTSMLPVFPFVPALAPAVSVIRAYARNVNFMRKEICFRRTDTLLENDDHSLRTV